jgi:signal transduction histidine kinase
VHRYPAGELNQAWTNIITNAAEAMRHIAAPDSILTVSTRLTDAATVQIEICDTGPGSGRRSLADLSAVLHHEGGR